MAGASAAETSAEHKPDGCSARFKAPLLSRILEGLDAATGREVILDLGAACPALLTRLAANPGRRIEIADLVDSGGIKLLNADIAEYDLAGLEGLLPDSNQAELSLVLCWDLPNYLSPEALSRLAALLRNRAAPGCRLHMLITYSRQDMPEEPGRYVLDQESHLLQFGSDSGRAVAPRYTPEEIGKSMAGFRYERGILLANGMQEFVYVWPGQPQAPPVRTVEFAG